MRLATAILTGHVHIRGATADGGLLAVNKDGLHFHSGEADTECTPAPREKAGFTHHTRLEDSGSLLGRSCLSNCLGEEILWQQTIGLPSTANPASTIMGVLIA